MENEEPKLKGWQRILLLIIPYFVFVGIFQFTGFLMASVDLKSLEAEKTTAQHLIITFFNFTGTIVLLWFFMVFIDKEKFINLGFQIKNRFKHIYLGLLLGFAIMGFGLLILLAINQVKFLGITFSFKELLFSILIYIFVAITEEVLFRGYILRNFMASFNSYWALLLTSLVFAIAHGANPNMDWFSFLNLFLAGLLLGGTYIYSKNLWFPIALHFSWNLFQTLFGFNVSGQDFYSLIEFKTTEKNMINGGDFGFEGSIFSVALQVLLIGTIWFYFERIKPKKLRH